MYACNPELPAEYLFQDYPTEGVRHRDQWPCSLLECYVSWVLAQPLPASERLPLLA